MVQFWAGDYGMERCSLEFTLPASAAAETVFIHVWRVDAPQRLSPGTLAWDNRPKTNVLLISQEVKPNDTVRSEEFHCHSGSFQAFELGCAGDGCLVDFRQDPKLEAGTPTLCGLCACCYLTNYGSSQVPGWFNGHLCRHANALILYECAAFVSKDLTLSNETAPCDGADRQPAVYRLMATGPYGRLTSASHHTRITNWENVGYHHTSILR